MQNDERNYLYKYYVEFLKVRPEFSFFENVPGLVSAGGGKYSEDMRGLKEESRAMTQITKS